MDQYDWPNETLENPRGNPLLASAARIRGYVDTVNYLHLALLIRAAEMFEQLDKDLTEKLGPNWWQNTPLEAFAPKRKKKSAR